MKKKFWFVLFITIFALAYFLTGLTGCKIKKTEKWIEWKGVYCSMPNCPPEAETEIFNGYLEENSSSSCPETYTVLKPGPTEKPTPTIATLYLQEGSCTTKEVVVK